MLDPELSRLKYEGYQTAYIDGEPIFTDAVYSALLWGLGFRNSEIQAELAYAKELRNNKRERLTGARNFSKSVSLNENAQ